MLLSTAYFPPIQYFSKLVNSSSITIEGCENYQKQTYRNRCIIASANGSISLVVPVLKSSNPKQNIKDVKISYETNWQRIHYRSIMSAYRHSPFYEYFIEDMVFAWEKPEKYLFGLNIKIMNVLLELSGIEDINIQISTEYIEQNVNKSDWRELIHPKKKIDDDEYRLVPYQQVFNDRFGFQSNLSIIDALFQLGPETRILLRESNPKI